MTIKFDELDHPDKVWSIYQYVDSHFDLDFRPIDLKIDKDHLHPNTHVCPKFDKPRSVLSLVITGTRFGLRSDPVLLSGICDEK